MNKEIPGVLSLPLLEEETIIPLYPNPQHHVREGMRGSWLRFCSRCKKRLATTINPIPGRKKAMLAPGKRYYKKPTKKPYSIYNIKLLKSKRKPIFCLECNPPPKERFNEDEEYFAYSDSLDKRKQLTMHKKYRVNNKEKIRTTKQAYYEKNKEKIKAIHKKYKVKNKEKIKVWHREYNVKNKEKIMADQKAYREKNKDKIKAYREEHKEQQRDRILKTTQKAEAV